MLPTVNELLTKMYEDDWSYRQIKRKLEDFGIIVSHMSIKRQLVHLKPDSVEDLEVPRGDLLKEKYANDVISFLIELSVEQLEIIDNSWDNDNMKEPSLYSHETLKKFWFDFIEKHVPEYSTILHARYNYYLKNRNVLDMQYSERIKNIFY